MPAIAETKVGKEQFVDCVETAEKLLLGKMVKVGNKYGWTVTHEIAFTDENLLTQLNQLFNSYGFTITINGNNQVEVDGTF